MMTTQLSREQNGLDTTSVLVKMLTCFSLRTFVPTNTSHLCIDTGTMLVCHESKRSVVHILVSDKRLG